MWYDSMPVYGFLLASYSNFVSQMHRFKDIRYSTLGSLAIARQSLVHKSVIAQEAVCDCGFIQLDHPVLT